MTRGPAFKSDYDAVMFTLQKGDCEHCGRTFHLALLNASFGDYSYAYCDTCGTLATIGYTSGTLLKMPKPSASHQVIDREWEPFLRPCSCGGRFRCDAAPRCVFCTQPLSAEYAASHIERNTIGATRGWRWQRNWTDVFCLALEDPKSPGTLRQVSDPFSHPDSDKNESSKHRWFDFFGSKR